MFSVQQLRAQSLRRIDQCARQPVITARRTHVHAVRALDFGPVVRRHRLDGEVVLLELEGDGLALAGSEAHLAEATQHARWAGSPAAGG